MISVVEAWKRLSSQRDYRVGLKLLIAFWVFFSLMEWGVAAADIYHPVSWLRVAAWTPGAAALACSLGSAFFLVRGWRRRGQLAAVAPADVA